MAFWRKENQHREVSKKLDDLDTKLELRLSRLEAALRKENYDIPETGKKVEEEELNPPVTRQDTVDKPKGETQNSLKVSDIAQQVMKPKTEAVQLKSLDDQEKQFWEEIIGVYLMPEKKKTEQEANDVQQKLLDLRNQGLNSIEFQLNF